MRRALLALLLACPVAPPLSAASVDGLGIHAASVGSGPTLVFVHGWTCDSSSWDGQVPAFSGDYRVITLDLPGHGRSDSPPDGKFSMNLLARRCHESADEVLGATGKTVVFQPPELSDVGGRDGR